MPQRNRFGPYRRTALAAAIALALPAGAQAAAARVDFVIGQVFVVSEEGVEQKVAKGATIESGEMVRTKRGRAQLRFTDGAFLSLKPETDFRIDEYHFSGQEDGTERGFFSIVKGGFRTLTGLIGKTNNAAYKIETPVATIGIRGSGMDCVVDAIMMACGIIQGTVCGSNARGSACANEGEILSAEEGQGPQVTTQQGNRLDAEEAAQVEEEEHEAGEDTIIEALPPVPTTPTCVGECTLWFVNQGEPNAVREGFASNVSATFDENGVLKVYSADGVDEINFGNFGTQSSHPGGSADVGNTNFEGGADDVIGWFRWSGGSILTTESGDLLFPHPSQLDGGESFHGFIGIATPEPEMPRGSASYDLLGATDPTGALTHQVGTLNSGSLEVDFDDATVAASLNLTMFGQDINANAGMAIMGNQFAGNGFAIGSEGGEGFTLMNGQFMGPGAARAGLIYEIDFFDCDQVCFSDIINGAAAFTK